MENDDINEFIASRIIKPTPRGDGIDYYSFLDVNPQSTVDEIKQAYKKIVVRIHPDKRAKILLNTQCDPETYDKIFNIASEAWSILGNEIERSRYDMEYGFKRSCPSSNEVNITNLQRTSAMNLQINMEHTAKIIAEEQASKGDDGLIITQAYYGCIPTCINFHVDVQKVATLFADVKRPVQVLIQDSKIIYPNPKINGISTLSRIAGFHDVAPGQPKYLLIRYRSFGRMHQAIINDFDPIQIPMRAHMVLETGVTMEMTTTDYQKKFRHQNTSNSKQTNIPTRIILILATVCGSCYLLSRSKSLIHFLNDYLKKLRLSN